MKQVFYKAWPIAAGLLLGMLWFVPLPPPVASFRLLVIPVVIGVGFLMSTLAQFKLSFPEEVELEPLPSLHLPPEQAMFFMEEFRRIGFEPFERPVTIHLRPSAQLWPFIHRQHPCLGSVYVTGTVPSKVAFEFNSILQGDRGTLTSVATRLAATLPSPPGHFKLLVEGFGPAELFHRHLEAQAYLASRGIRIDPVPAGSVVERIRKSMSRQREFIRARSIRVALVMLWRLVVRRTPYSAPLAKQRTTEASIQYLHAGLTTSRSAA